MKRILPLLALLTGCASAVRAIDDTTGGFFKHGTETFWGVVVGSAVYFLVPYTGIAQAALTALGSAVGVIFSHTDPPPYQAPGFFEALPGRILGIVVLWLLATVALGGEHRWHILGLLKRGAGLVKGAIGRMKGIAQ